MPCYKPLTAYRCFNGSVVFDELRRYDTVKTLSLPCGKCAGCRLERSREWAMRCMHEASMYEENCYVTLTYNDANLSDNWSLDYRDFQLFMRRLRAREVGREIRFYMAGEYGEVCKVCRKSVEFCKCASFVKDLGRPHFHACLFNYDFPDKVYDRKSPSGEKLYRSGILEDLWPVGYSSVGAVTFDSAAYVARYIMKKIVGDESAKHYEFVDQVSGEVVSRRPEFNKMSLKPGIGARWLDKYEHDVFPSGRVVVRGFEGMSPRYYDKRWRQKHPLEFEQLEYEREREARLRWMDNTPERLAVKEHVKLAQIRMLKRRVN